MMNAGENERTHGERQVSDYCSSVASLSIDHPSRHNAHLSIRHPGLSWRERCCCRIHFVVGHDRGGRSGHRMVLGHPAHVLTLTVMDIVPTYAMFNA